MASFAPAGVFAAFAAAELLWPAAVPEVLAGVVLDDGVVLAAAEGVPRGPCPLRT